MRRFRHSRTSTGTIVEVTNTAPKAEPQDRSAAALNQAAPTRHVRITKISAHPTAAPAAAKPAEADTIFRKGPVNHRRFIGRDSTFLDDCPQTFWPKPCHLRLWRDTDGVIVAGQGTPTQGLILGVVWTVWATYSAIRPTVALGWLLRWARWNERNFGGPPLTPSAEVTKEPVRSGRFLIGFRVASGVWAAFGIYLIAAALSRF